MSPARQGSDAAPPRRDDDRLAAVAFAGGCAVALVLLLRIGVEQWFFLDEWDFLADRTAWDVDDLFRPHNEHWSTIPILLYRAVYRLVGLATYLPYRAMAVTTHLACAVLMRVLLRRVGVGPWLASAVVLPWILFGAGWEDIVWGFQVAWNSALALSMAQLLLADHDGPRDRRDVLGVGAGVLSLMCAGIAVPLAATVGLCVWVRRGWRAALLHVAPVAAVYAVWSSRFGDATDLDTGLRRDKVRFVWEGLSSAVHAFAWTVPAALALTALVAAGAWVRWRRLDGGGRREQLGVPVGLALGALAFLVVIGSGRTSFGVEFARSSRYLHVVSYLLLPLLGVAAAAVIDHVRATSSVPRHAAGVGVLALLWIGIPANLAEFSDEPPARHLQRGHPEVLRTMAGAVLDQPHLPPEGQPLPVLAPYVTIGWLREAVREGALEPLVTDVFFTNALTKQGLQLVQVDEDADPDRCEPLDRPVTLDLDRGDRVALEARRIEASVGSPTAGEFDVLFRPYHGETLQATDPLTVTLRNADPAVEAQLCR